MSHRDPDGPVQRCLVASTFLCFGLSKRCAVLTEVVLLCSGGHMRAVEGAPGRAVQLRGAAHARRGARAVCGGGAEPAGGEAEGGLHRRRVLVAAGVHGSGQVLRSEAGAGRAAQRGDGRPGGDPARGVAAERGRGVRAHLRERDDHGDGVCGGPCAHRHRRAPPRRRLHLDPPLPPRRRGQVRRDLRVGREERGAGGGVPGDRAQGPARGAGAGVLPERAQLRHRREHQAHPQRLQHAQHALGARRAPDAGGCARQGRAQAVRGDLRGTCRPALPPHRLLPRLLRLPRRPRRALPHHHPLQHQRRRPPPRGPLPHPSRASRPLPGPPPPPPLPPLLDAAAAPVGGVVL
eukprot:3936920-Rhodomonas_salina.2